MLNNDKVCDKCGHGFMCKIGKHIHESDSYKGGEFKQDGGWWKSRRFKSGCGGHSSHHSILCCGSLHRIVGKSRFIASNVSTWCYCILIKALSN